jgi:hypothetical protein
MHNLSLLNAAYGVSTSSMLMVCMKMNAEKIFIVDSGVKKLRNPLEQESTESNCRKILKQ